MLTDTEMLAMLTELVTPLNLWDPAAIFVGVASAIVNNGALTDLADVTEATGAMAPRQAVTTWDDPQKLTSGIWVVDSPVLNYTPASAVEAQSVAGVYWATLAVAGDLRGFEMISPLVQCTDEFHPFEFVLRLGINPAGVASLIVKIPV